MLFIFILAWTNYLKFYIKFVDQRWLCGQNLVVDPDPDPEELDL